MLLIKNTHVMDPASGLDAEKDILVSEGKILKISNNISASESCIENNCTVIDAKGCVAAPGLIDTHSHFRDPGFTAKEDIHTGSLAAAKGGYTSIVMMANTNPPIDDPDVLKAVLKRGRNEKIHIYSAANVTLGMNGEERSDLASLKDAGAVVFTDDGKPITDEYILKDALKLAQKLHRPVSLHEEDPAYVTEPGVNAGGEAAAALGLTGADRLAEITMIKRDVDLALETGASLCIQHISTAEGVDLVRKARTVSDKIHAEATPHHFSLTEEAVTKKGTLAKVNPPIRLESDRQAIIEGIKDGTIDIIATDHAPHTEEEKSREFTKAPSGMTGLETALSLGIKNLVAPGHISLMKLLELITITPAKFYDLPAGRLSEGSAADIVIFDPDAKWTVTKESFASKACNSPFTGDTLPGVVHMTIASGNIVYTDNTLI